MIDIGWYLGVPILRPNWMRFCWNSTAKAKSGWFRILCVEITELKSRIINWSRAADQRASQQWTVWRCSWDLGQDPRFWNAQFLGVSMGSKCAHTSVRQDFRCFFGDVLSAKVLQYGCLFPRAQPMAAKIAPRVILNRWLGLGIVTAETSLAFCVGPIVR